MIEEGFCSEMLETKTANLKRGRKVDDYVELATGKGGRLTNLRRSRVARVGSSRQPSREREKRKNNRDDEKKNETRFFFLNRRCASYLPKFVINAK